jgi:hypothetical protein
MQGFTDADVIAAAHAWLKQQTPTPCCPMCKADKWRVGMICYMPEQLTGKPYHVVPLECCQCGYISLISGVKVMGESPPGR